MPDYEYRGDITVEVRVDIEDLVAEWIAEKKIQTAELLADLGAKGAEKAREHAPEGKKRDPRTLSLKESISSEVDGDSATVRCTARHANIIESGGGPALMKGGTPNPENEKWPWTSPPGFIWEGAPEGPRKWVPGPNFIKHPATEAKPYLKPALEEMLEEWPEVAEFYYG